MMKRMSMAVLAGIIGVSESAGTTYNIPSPKVVGNAAAVAALTNAFAEVGKADTTDAKILLAPGIYDLKGTQIGTGGAHWRLDKKMKNGLIAGTGATPGDTVLLGGGDTDKKRVFHIWSTDASKPTVISNLTITGGYTTGDGGAISGSTPTYGGNLILSHVIISNNYAKGSNGAGGGGVIFAKAYNCVFSDNVCETQRGGGLYVNTASHGAWDCVFSNNSANAANMYGGGLYATEGAACVGCKFYDNAGVNGSGACANGLVSNCVFRGNKPTAAANSNKLGGGLYLASSGECVDCKFFDNAADRGGGMYVSSSSASVRNCLFEGNKQTGWASGAALFVNASSPLAIVSNCVFRANVARVESSRTIISNAHLVDCTIRDHAVTNGYVLAGCSMTRCLFADNYGANNAQHLDIGTIYGGTTVSRTNVDCVVVNNRAVSGSGSNVITEGKKIVNCTYVRNSSSASGGAIIRNCAAWNTLLTENTVAGLAKDVNSTSLYLTNCIFSASSVAVDSANFSGCKIVSTFSFRETESGGEFDIRSSSKAFGAGVWEDWMADAVGPLDFAGRQRVMFGAIDVGALECQLKPGALLIFR